jgi:hypothetical protein
MCGLLGRAFWSALFFAVRPSDRVAYGEFGGRKSRRDASGTTAGCRLVEESVGHGGLGLRLLS